MEPGDIVEFFEEKRIFCGVVLELKGERLHVLTQTSREMTLTPKRVLHVGPRLAIATLSRQELLSHLEATARQREALKDGINLEDLWDLLASEGQTVSVAEMAELWFGQMTPDQVAATGQRLREDRFLFKQKDGLVTPNPPEVVEQLQEQHSRELLRQRELDEIAGWLEKVWAGQAAAAGPWKDRVVELLRRMALWGAEVPDYAQGKAFLDKARLNPVEAPFRLLVRLGVWQEDEDLDLHRLEVPLKFSPEALVLARQSAQSPPPDRYAAQRQDLTHLNIMTIDGERTRDFDDALSLEEAPEGWRLGIHIADVSAHVLPQSPLDLEAQERGTSIYLPERRLPMLPEELSEDTVSLLANQERLALSFLVTLGADAEIKDWVIVPSLIRVGRRLTYHEVDGLLTQDPQLATLSRLTRRLKERRLARGGYELKLPEVWVTFTPQGDIQVVVEDQETASHQLVGEAMVLANSLASQFLAEQGIAGHLSGPTRPPGAHPAVFGQEPAGTLAGPAPPEPGGDGPLTVAPLGPGAALLHLCHVPHPALPGPGDPPSASGGGERPPAGLPARGSGPDPGHHRTGHAASRATENPASALLAPEAPVGPGGSEVGGPGAGKNASPLPPHAA